MPSFSAKVSLGICGAHDWAINIQSLALALCKLIKGRLDEASFFPRLRSQLCRSFRYRLDLSGGTPRGPRAYQPFGSPEKAYFWQAYSVYDPNGERLCKVEFPRWREPKTTRCGVQCSASAARNIQRHHRPVVAYPWLKNVVCFSSLLFDVGDIVQNWRSVFSLDYHGWFSCKGRE